MDISSLVQKHEQKNYTNPHCFISIVGPSGYGKTHLVSQMNLDQKNILSASGINCTFTNISNLITNHLLGCIRETISIEIHERLECATLDENEAAKLRTLVIIDDLYQDGCEDASYFNLVVAVRHRNEHLMT